MDLEEGRYVVMSKMERYGITVLQWNKNQDLGWVQHLISLHYHKLNSALSIVSVYSRVIEFTKREGLAMLAIVGTNILSASVTTLLEELYNFPLYTIKGRQSIPSSCKLWLNLLNIFRNVRWQPSCPITRAVAPFYGRNTLYSSQEHLQTEFFTTMLVLASCHSFNTTFEYETNPMEELQMRPSFVCKNHMMTSMWDVERYSVPAAWAKQEFNFAQGGTLEFQVNTNLGHTSRRWCAGVVDGNHFASSWNPRPCFLIM